VVHIFNDDTSPNPDPKRPSRLMKDILCLNGSLIDDSYHCLRTGSLINGRNVRGKCPVTNWFSHWKFNERQQTINYHIAPCI